jgi:hypothetical protein
VGARSHSTFGFSYLEIQICLVSLELTAARMVIKIHTVPKAKTIATRLLVQFILDVSFGLILICTGLDAPTLPNAATGELSAEPPFREPPPLPCCPGTQRDSA